MFANEMPWIVSSPVPMFAGDTKNLTFHKDDYATLQNEY